MSSHCVGVISAKDGSDLRFLVTFSKAILILRTRTKYPSNFLDGDIQRATTDKKVIST